VDGDIERGGGGVNVRDRHGREGSRKVKVRTVVGHFCWRKARLRARRLGKYGGEAAESLRIV
jgi:hypothetical protein